MIIRAPYCIGPTNRPVEEHGFVLALCLPLLATLAIMSLATLMSAILEMRMSANHEHRERAYQAAEYAVEEALASTDLSTQLTLSAPKIVPGSGDRTSIPGSLFDGYNYRLYFLAAVDPGETVLTGNTGLQAFHFVVEATGFSARGAKDLHVQGFYVLRPVGWTSDALCPDPSGGCVEVSTATPKRTFWSQPDSE